MAATSTSKNSGTVDPVIASKVDQIRAQPYATSIVAEDVIERNFGYKIIRQQVSTGRNSMIYKCESVRYPDSYCLVKPYKLGKDKIKTVLREETCQIMRFVTAKCPQVISTYDLFYTNEKIYLMCDWSQKGEVLSCMKAKSIRLTEELLHRWTIDILNAVQFLHSNAICHRNIAPNSLLLTSNDRVKIGTLSDACIYCKSDGTLLKQKWSAFSRDTNWNQAPEVAKLKPFDPRRADIWSIGATIYWFICRTYPIDYRSNQRMTKQMDYRMSFLRRVSKKCQAFVKRLLTFQPPLRPTIEQTLELEWISGSVSPATSPAEIKHSPSGVAAEASSSAKGVPVSTSTSQKPHLKQPTDTGPTGAGSPELAPQAHSQPEPGDTAGPDETGAPEQISENWTSANAIEPTSQSPE